MTEVILDIKQWGNNLGVRLPAVIVREARVHVDQQVKLTVASGQIIITPVQDKALTLEQRVAQFDPAKHGGEAMVSEQRLGAEKW